MLIQREKYNPSMRKGSARGSAMYWIDSDFSGMTLENSQRCDLATPIQAVLESYFAGTLHQASNPLLSIPVCCLTRERLEVSEQFTLL